MPTVLRFSPDAQALFFELEELHLNLDSYEAINKKLASHIGKFDGLFARLCVAFHVIDHAGYQTLPREISVDVARRVEVLLHKFLLPHALAFYQNVVGISDNDDAVKSTAGYILTHPERDELTHRDMLRGDSVMKKLTDHRASLAVFEQLEAFGWLTRIPEKGNQTSPRFRVNPRVRVLFAERAIKEAGQRSKVRELLANLAKDKVP